MLLCNLRQFWKRSAKHFRSLHHHVGEASPQIFHALILVRVRCGRNIVIERCTSHGNHTVTLQNPQRDFLVALSQLLSQHFERIVTQTAPHLSFFFNVSIHFGAFYNPSNAFSVNTLFFGNIRLRFAHDVFLQDSHALVDSDAISVSVHTRDYAGLNYWLLFACLTDFLLCASLVINFFESPAVALAADGIHTEAEFLLMNYPVLLGSTAFACSLRKNQIIYPV